MLASLLSWFAEHLSCFIDWSAAILLCCCFYLWAVVRRTDRRSLRMLEFSPSGIALVDPDNHIISFANSALQKLLCLQQVSNEFSFHHQHHSPVLELLQRSAVLEQTSAEVLWLDGPNGRFPVQFYARKVAYRGRKKWFCVVTDLSHIEFMEQHLAREQKLFSDVMGAIPQRVCCVDRSGAIINCNDSWARFHGMKAQDLVGKLEFDFIPAAELLKRRATRDRVLGGEQVTDSRWLLTPDGSQRLFLENHYPLRGEKGVYAVLSVMQDITDWQRLHKQLETENAQRIQTESQLAIQNSFTRTVFQATPDPIAFIDPNGNLIDCNLLFAHQFGFTREQLKGNPLKHYLPEVIYSCLMENNEQVLADNSTICQEENIEVQGASRWYELVKAPHQDSDSKVRGIFLIIRDISEHKRVAERLAMVVEELDQLSITDHLTRLANRRAFEVRGRQLWKDLRREFSPCSVLLCEIDELSSFHSLSTTEECELLVVKVASTLSELVMRSSDTLARIDDGKFAILLPNTHLDGAAVLAEKVVKEVYAANISAPVSNRLSRMTVSVGVASMVPGEACQFEDLVAMTDEALMQAKAAGRNCYRKSLADPAGFSRQSA